MFKFPWTNFHELNLDWILHEIKVVKEKVEELFEKLKELAERVTGAEAYIEGVDTRVTYLEDHPYVLPQADGERLGGIKARARDAEEENLEVKIDPVTGILYTKGDFSDYVEVDGQTVNTEGYFAYVGAENLFQLSPESFSIGMSDDASAHIDFSMYVDVNDAPHLRINSFDDMYLNPFNGEQNSKLRYITSGDETALDEIANKQYVLSHGGGGGSFYINRIQISHSGFDHGKAFLFIISRSAISNPHNGADIATFMHDNGINIAWCMGSIENEVVFNVNEAGSGTILVANSATNQLDVTGCSVGSWWHDVI